MKDTLNCAAKSNILNNIYFLNLMFYNSYFSKQTPFALLKALLTFDLLLMNFKNRVYFTSVPCQGLFCQVVCISYFILKSFFVYSIVSL